MSYKAIELEKLNVNRSNDRHDELENETAAIAWLFNHHRSQMKKLARDIVESKGLYEPPLVYLDGAKYTVFDGNRRITCLKLLANPKRAPSIELQKFFVGLREKWVGTFPKKVMCRVETDRDVIDDILFRRHTGSQGGVGQANWDGRMKTTFVNRTGKGGKLNVADEIEEQLRQEKLLPERKKLPRSNLNRLLSAEAFRNRVGISTAKGKLEFTRRKEAVMPALARIADDLASKRITLDDVWDVDRKSAYLDTLENEGVLPTAADAVKTNDKPGKGKRQTTKTKKATQPEKRVQLIPDTDYGVAWSGRLQRHHSIWDELQFSLDLEHHPNAIAVLCRVLLELSVDNYIGQSKISTVSEADPLVKKIVGCAEELEAKGKIEKRYLQVIRKARTMDEIVSIDTLNKYVHSSSLAPAPKDLASLWDTFAPLIVLFLNE